MYRVLFVLDPRVFVRLLLVAATAVLHAQHCHNGGQYGHRHGHGQHDHQQPVDRRLGHDLWLIVVHGRGHMFGPVAKRGRPLVCTIGTHVTGRTLTLVTIAAIGRYARSAIGTRRRCTLVHVSAAVLTAEPGAAAAPKIILQVLALASVCARFRHAIVHLALALIADIAGYALAPVTVGQRLTRTTVLARVLLYGTLVRQMAVGAREPGRALARVTGIVSAGHARGPVPARVWLTMVDSLMACRSGKPDWTVTQVCSTGAGAGVIASGLV